jgi:hypothetical protein
MKMSKQTAVSQIFAQIKAGRKDTKFWNDSMLVDWLLEQEERYKQMEKDQHEETWFSSRVEDMGDEFKVEQKSFEQYYNETYGGQDD